MYSSLCQTAERLALQCSRSKGSPSCMLSVSVGPACVRVSASAIGLMLVDERIYAVVTQAACLAILNPSRLLCACIKTPTCDYGQGDDIT